MNKSKVDRLTPVLVIISLGLTLTMLYLINQREVEIERLNTRAFEVELYYQARILGLQDTISKKDRIIKAQKEHFKDCSFIGRSQIKKVTNKYWIELRKDGEVW